MFQYCPIIPSRQSSTGAYNEVQPDSCLLSDLFNKGARDCLFVLVDAEKGRAIVGLRRSFGRNNTSVHVSLTNDISQVLKNRNYAIENDLLAALEISGLHLLYFHRRHLWCGCTARNDADNG